MAAKTITAANVILSATGKFKDGKAGAAITQGQPVYLHTDQKYYLSDADAAAPANKVDGIALNSAAANQPLRVATQDSAFTPGCTLTVGEVLVVGNTAGTLHPSADLTTGWVPMIVFVATSTTQGVLNCGQGALKGTAAIG
jgi:hypothetical protein